MEKKMTTKNQKVTGKKIQVTAANQLQAIRDKFKALKEIRDKINAMKTLYQEHDILMAELMPLFIDVSADEFVIKREITVGNKKYRFTPYFYDDKKGQIGAKVWKSTAFPAGSIE
jgi:hypothetical protein